MKNTAGPPDEYLESMSEDRKEAMIRMRQTILHNLPAGFEETISYGMIGYIVPHSLCPAGYHADPKLPLPFINIGSQKNHIALHHLGIYADNALRDWFLGEYPKHSPGKPDLGKGCIRFRKTEDIPFDLIGELVKKITVEKWIRMYESTLRKKS
jgi:hypothetical protein